MRMIDRKRATASEAETEWYCNPWDALAKAIVLQAVEDIKAGEKAVTEHEAILAAPVRLRDETKLNAWKYILEWQRNMRSAHEFIGSAWYARLTEMDADEIRRHLNEYASAHRYQWRQNGRRRAQKLSERTEIMHIEYRAVADKNGFKKEFRAKTRAEVMRMLSEAHANGEITGFPMIEAVKVSEIFGDVEKKEESEGRKAWLQAFKSL